MTTGNSTMVKIETHSGPLTDDIKSLAQSYEYKPYFFASAATPDALNRMFISRLEKFLIRCEASPDVIMFLATDESGALVGFAGPECLDFDSAALNTPSGRLAFVVTKPGEYFDTRPIADALVKASMEWLKGRGIVFTNIRTAALELPTIHAVESAGFYLVDNGFTAIYHKDNVPDYIKGSFDIRLFAEKDLPVVMEILAGAYHTDRFHLDPKIPKEAAEALYKVWVHHSCMSPKDQEWVLIAERKGVVKGFFQYEYNHEFSEATGIGLFTYGPAAVVRDKTALGAYYSLLSFAINDSVMRGGTYAMTRIPFAIQPILKLTLRLGPSFMSNDLTFHHWVK